MNCFLKFSSDQSLEDAGKIMGDSVENPAKEPPTKEQVKRVQTRLLRAKDTRMTNSQSVGLNLSEWSAVGDWRLMFQRAITSKA